MTAQTTMNPGPRSSYSSENPAGQEAFKESAEPLAGAWRPADILEVWASTCDFAPSFWITGERKIGKTSFLLRLENLARRRGPSPARGAPILPLYVCCKDCPSLASFYAALLRRAELVAREDEWPCATGPTEGPPGPAGAGGLVARLESGAGAGGEIFDQVREALELWAARLSAAARQRVRLVALIDHADAARAASWVGPLLAHFRSLLTGTWAIPAEIPSPLGGLSLAIAGGRELADLDGEARLLDVAEEVFLRPLGWSEVRALVMGPGSLQLDNRWVERIYRATGGHPWLVQYVMESFVDLCRSDPRDLEDRFESIVGLRFQLDPSRSAVLRQWLDGLPEEGVEILSHLALESHVQTERDLPQRTGLPPRVVNERLRQMAGLGVLSKPPFVTSGPYVLTTIFEGWFLRHTGGRIYLDEIRRRQGGAAAAGSGCKPFQFLVSLDPGLIVADGFNTCFCPTTSPLASSVPRLASRTINARSEVDLIYVAEDLARDLLQGRWDGLLAEYFKESKQRGGEPQCILRFEDPRLVDLPIELLRHDGAFLALKVPVWKELTRQQGPAYHAASWTSKTEKLDVLLVASSVEGKFDGFGYPALPLSETEIREIAALLSRSREELGIGRIVALTNGREALPEDVTVHAATPARLDAALRGNLGGAFHLLHYSGHYVPDRQSGSGGLLLAGDGGLRLFSLAHLEASLEKTRLRLVFFNGCRTAEHISSPTAYYLGPAETALRNGVTAVVGMRWPVLDGDGLLLGRRFYEALARGGSPEIALWQARQRVHEEREREILWAAPVMLAR